MQKNQEVWLVYNASLLSLLRQTKGFFCFSFNKRSQKHAAAKTWVFCICFFSKTKRKMAKKNAAQCISSHLKATSKNSGTFENTPKKVDFPLSIVFDQALQMVIFSSNETFWILLFLYYSFGVEKTNTFIHSRGSLENHTQFKTIMVKIYTRFQTKTAQNPYPLGRHIPI